MRRFELSALLTLLALGFGLHCETPNRKRSGAASSEAEGETQIEDQLGRSASDLVAAAERLRDREFEQPPEFVAVDEFESELTPDQSDHPVDEADTAAARTLFGVPAFSVPARAPFADVARYAPSKHRIEFRRGFPSEETLELALIVALVDGLEHRNFSRSSPSAALDTRLAEHAARYSDDMLVAAAYRYERSDDSVAQPVAAIARRPEIALRLDGLSELLTSPQSDSGNGGESASDLQTRLRRFARREGLSLAAALYRAGGWSGVELLHEFRPRSTADVVRPDRWLAGRGLGTWDWANTSSGDESPETGRIGPALISLWLAQHFRPDLARTVYSGWRSDAFRLRESSESGDSDALPRPGMDWVHQWDTPTSARQISEAVQKVLASEYGPSKEGDVRWRVFRNGLTVGVAVRSDDVGFDSQTGGIALSNSTVRFRPRDALPLEFVPTRTDSFRRHVERTTIEDGTWNDPAAQLRLDIAPLDDWTFAESKTLPLRWFAKRKDGTVLQLSTELTDPLGPAFGSKAYRKSLKARFADSLESAEFQGTESVDQPVESAIRFSVAGEQKGERWKIGIWQFQYGDVVSTLSLQAPKKVYSKHTGVAEEIFSSVETLDPPPGEKHRPDESDSGTIEYEIESTDE